MNSLNTYKGQVAVQLSTCNLGVLETTHCVWLSVFALWRPVKVVPLPLTKCMLGQGRVSRDNKKKEWL